MGVLLGILTAFSWGGADFLARYSTHRIGTLRTMLYLQLIGLLLLSVFMPWLGGWGHLTDGSGWHPWAWGALAGVMNGFSALGMYRSFEIGKLSVVAPISASYPAITVLISLGTGERLSPARAVGIVLALAGVVLVAAGEKTHEDESGRPQPRGSRGVDWALGAACGYGVLFWALGKHIIPHTGAIQTVWLIRLTCVILTAAVVLLLKQPIRLPFKRPLPVLVVGMSVLDTCAFVANNRGMQLEQVSVMSVLASLYGAVTVALAAIVLREHVSRWQWLGIVSVFAGICLISR
jgi:drug/metabolite transporter (DMT)-like permease